MKKRFYFCSCFDKYGKACNIIISSDSKRTTKIYLQDNGYIINGLYKESEEWVNIFNNGHIDITI